MKVDKKAVKQKALETADSLGYELVDQEFKKMKDTLHVINYIYKKEGVTLDDCTKFSQALGKSLDDEDLFQEPYVLEVSSPGLDRPLKNERDYKRNIGNLVDVSLYSAFQGKKKFQGYLKDYNSEEIILNIDDEMIHLPISSISLMRQAIIF
ncbi:MAG: ribosome maturation factor RimP [Tissierellia bacterium]|nr:ribosome maturation factor RimP [Tissierellia bacterium]